VQIGAVGLNKFIPATCYFRIFSCPNMHLRLLRPCLGAFITSLYLLASGMELVAPLKNQSYCFLSLTPVFSVLDLNVLLPLPFSGYAYAENLVRMENDDCLQYCWCCCCLVDKTLSGSTCYVHCSVHRHVYNFVLLIWSQRQLVWYCTVS